MKFNIVITFSKIVAVVILGLTYHMEMNDKSSGVFYLALGAVVFLITGKQLINAKYLNKKDEE